ncbi:MAG: hypothetical protein ACKN9R_05335 [Candidatus Limnocylindrus sp.]
MASHRGWSSAAVVLGLIGMLAGTAQLAWGSGNNGACEVMRAEINMGGFPPNENWVFGGFACTGPCPPTYQCSFGVPQEIRDGEVLIGYRLICICAQPDDGNPNTIEFVQMDLPGQIECDTAGITDVSGNPVNTQCLQQECPVTCVYASDPNVTDDTFQVPPGSGHWRDRRWRECSCP